MKARPTSEDFNKMTIGAYIKMLEKWAKEAETEITELKELLQGSKKDPNQLCNHWHERKEQVLNQRI